MLWMMNPSIKYYEPVSASVERTVDGRWTATITRLLPRGDVSARWSVAVWVRRGEASFVCMEPMGVAVPYYKSDGPTVSYELPHSVTRCMNEAPPISVTWRRQIMLFGWLPLLPVSTTITVNSSIMTIDRDS